MTVFVLLGCLVIAIVISMAFSDELVVDCDACGEEIVEGTDHDCPVGGNVVWIERDTA